MQVELTRVFTIIYITVQCIVVSYLCRNVNRNKYEFAHSYVIAIGSFTYELTIDRDWIIVVTTTTLTERIQETFQDHSQDYLLRYKKFSVSSIYNVNLRQNCQLKVVIWASLSCGWYHHSYSLNELTLNLSLIK